MKTITFDDLLVSDTLLAKDIKAAIKAKFGTIRAFYSENSINSQEAEIAFRMKTPDSIGKVRAMIHSAKVGIPQHKSTDEFRAAIKEALRKYDSVSAFCDEENAKVKPACQRFTFTPLFIYRVVDGRKKKITRNMQVLANALNVSISKIANHAQ